MDELQLSGTWLMILTAQVSIILVLPFLLFKFESTLQTIKDTINIIIKHADATTLGDIKPSINSFEKELRKDESRVERPGTWIFAIGLIIIVSTMLIANFLDNDVRTTKSIRTNDFAYHQKESVFLISPAEWEIKLTELPNTLGLKQDDIVNSERLLFVETIRLTTNC